MIPLATLATIAALAAAPVAAQETAAVAVEAPTAPAAPAASAAPAAPVPGSGEALLAEAFGPSAKPSAVAATTSAEASTGKLWALALLLVGAGGAAAWFAKKQRAQRPGAVHLQVLQVSRIGHHQSLVVARVGDETLVLGATEGGIQVLATRVQPLSSTEPVPSHTAGPLSHAARTGHASQGSPQNGRPSHLANAAHAAYGLQSVFGGGAANASRNGPEGSLEELGGFARALEQANEDQELRAKLSMRRAP